MSNIFPIWRYQKLNTDPSPETLNLWSQNNSVDTQSFLFFLWIPDSCPSSNTQYPKITYRPETQLLKTKDMCSETPPNYKIVQCEGKHPHFPTVCEKYSYFTKGCHGFLLIGLLSI
jgi:hypothetical protein